MVPEPVTRRQPLAAAPSTGHHPDVSCHLVGPSGSLPADNQFGLALTGLWHAVSLGGGAVGFVPPVQRPEVAAVAAGVVADLRAGRSLGVALIADRQLVGFANLRPGSGLTAHTGEIILVMVDPALQGRRLGSLLINRILALATERGLERVTLSIRDGEGLQGFYSRFGFVEWGRRPGWVRVGQDDDRDEIFYWADLGQADSSVG